MGSRMFRGEGIFRFLERNLAKSVMLWESDCPNQPISKVLGMKDYSDFSNVLYLYGVEVSLVKSVTIITQIRRLSFQSCVDPSVML